MGNSADKGFSNPQAVSLKDIRRKTNRHIKEMATTRKRRSSALMSKEKKKKPKETTTELDKDSVKKYVVNSPEFLDELIINHISEDRVKRWLKARKEKSSEVKRKESDPDFTAELTERSFRHRHIMLITRSRLLYPGPHGRSELNDLIERPQCEDYEEDIESHLFAYTEVAADDISRIFILMVEKLLGKYAFPMPELCYFLSTLKANYHSIEYHNYFHALSHAQSMYWILRKNAGVFNELEMKCLMIAAIAHDVAHPGVNDSYLRATGGGLEKLYHSPILENHHIQTCFLILQDINCNVFSDLDGDDYKQVLDEIEYCILSTSLNRYKAQCENMRHKIGKGLDLGKKSVRDAVKSVLMMTCDLCASWKTWQEHKNTVWALYKEFFSQGDKEMNFQMDSAPQFMRMNADKIPEYQVFFLENITIPVFQIAVKVFPNIKEIMDSTTENLELWNTYL